MGKLLLLGGTGYLGARLAVQLSKNHEVTVASRTLAHIKKKWLEAFGLNHVYFDSLSPGSNYQVILHAALPSSQEAAKDKDLARATAIQSATLCHEMIERGAKKLIHFSSFHVYGARGQRVYSEEDLISPTTPYGEMHAAAEETYKKLGTPVSILRPMNIVGAPAHSDLGQQWKLFFFDLCRQALESQRLNVLTDGVGYRDFVPMADLLSCVDHLLGQESNGIFNLGSGKTISLRELASLIAEESGKSPLPIAYGDKKDPFPQPFQVNLERLKNIGWVPEASLRAEISHIFRFFQENL